MHSSKPPRPKPLNWTPPSSLSVFVRNLQLLQLDRRDDAPELTVSSLAPTSQNQRNRLKVIEWALYYLVAMWDPETARDSVNLRAALFRVLSELKKTGDLGRETILRKSMLDDCKGEKFDELLAVFSTAVLRKVLSASSDDRLQNLSAKIATAQGLTREEYQMMLPLILSHRVSLKTIGERRNRLRNTHETFAQLLDDKKVQLDERSSAYGVPLPAGPSVDLHNLSQEVKANWLGSAEWADTLIEGGSRSSSDAFLELPFETAWAKATKSTVDELTVSSTPDLLIDLESRVLRQRARLHRWRQYDSSMRSQNQTDPSHSKTTNVPLVFRDHQALTVASVSKAVLRQPVERVSLKADDRSLLFSMTEALTRINGPSQATRAQRPHMESSPRRTPNEPAGGTNESPPPPLDDLQDAAITPPLITGNNTPSLVYPPEDQYPTEVEPEKPRRNPAALVERTRKSMSLFPPSDTNPRLPRESLRPRRPRSSFPVNQFDTPEKQRASRTYDISRASTPRDELFEEEAEYSSVFKSRPRVEHSPLTSPAVHVSPIGEFELDMTMDMDGEMDDAVGVDSPLPRRRR
ncbi:hypothetical protein FE257_009955 [Aspergillus nanangensis]|uniref:HAUS augmin-like complex subunit 6 N-terminal domain-containing protein n=1 Tax=Aspergillus nanangensis TaxID=2582783 RepID=A0AAD4GYI3_ASPNN|nr:hypothetical protein FE257_009955 [Aspergillus nanangensis]